MSLFAPVILKGKYGKFYESLLEQKERGILSKFTKTTVNEQEIWNIVGSLEVKPEDLVDGKLPFKIGTLSGDLILYIRECDESIIPEKLGGKIIFKDVEPIKEENRTEKQAVISEKSIDWNERHFQICLALLSRADISSRGGSNDPQLPKIIKTADRMVELLKEHYAEPSKDK